MEKAKSERIVPPSRNRKAQEEMISAMRLRQEKYTTVVNDREFVVYPNVFSPHYVLDSSFYCKNLPNQRGKEMLEVGSGTGVIAVTAALQGAQHVIAVDINPRAVENTVENAKRHGVAEIITAYQSDIFDSVPEGQTFDTILWNVPWGDFGRGEDLDLIQRAFYDPEYKLLRRFILQTPRFLRPKGKLLIGFSTTIGSLEILGKLLKEAGFSARVVAEEHFDSGHPAGAVNIEFFEAELIDESKKVVARK